MAATTPTPTEPLPHSTFAAVWGEAALLTGWVWLLGWLPLFAAAVSTPDSAGWFGEPTGPPTVQIDPRWLAVAGPLLIGVGWLLSYRWEPYRLAEPVRVFFAVVGVAAAGWLVVAGYTSPLTASPYLAMAAAPLAVGWWALHYVADRRQLRGVLPATPEAPSQEPELAAMRRMLDRSHNADVVILDLKATRAGQTWEFGPRTHDPETGQALHDLPDYVDFRTRMPRLRTHIQAHWRARGVEFDDNDIRDEPGKVDRWYLHINTAHPERENIPASRRPAGPRSWNMPVWLGLYLDGGDMELAMCGRNMKVLGKTGGGKSVIGNNLIRGALTARDLATGRRDCAVFVFATQKLGPLVYPWLRPWLDGTMAFPPLTWAAGEDPQEVLRGWRALYRLAVYRNQQLAAEDKLTVSSASPGTIVFWEEARHGGDTSATISMGNGEMWGISRLCHETMAICRSAGISVVPFTQEGLFEGIGPYGAQAQRNFSAFACTRTTSHADTVLNLTALEGMGVDTTKLANNTIYLQPDTGDEARAMPGKCAEVRTEGIIAPLVLAEVAPLGDVVFPPDEVAAMGEDFTGRWQRARNPILAAQCDKKGWPWREPGHASAPATATPMTTQTTTTPATAGASPVPAPAVAAPLQPEGEPAVPHMTPDLPPLPAAATWTDSDEEYLRRLAADPGYDQPDQFGLPSQASLDDLDRLAREAAEWSERQYGGGAAPAPAAVVTGVPHPLPAVMTALEVLRARAGGRLEWVATAELAHEIYELTGDQKVDAETTRKMGRDISAALPELRTTNPRWYGPGKSRRGNGYIVAELDAALHQYRR